MPTRLVLRQLLRFSLVLDNKGRLELQVLFFLTLLLFLLATEVFLLLRKEAAKLKMGEVRVVLYCGGLYLIASAMEDKTSRFTPERMKSKRTR